MVSSAPSATADTTQRPAPKALLQCDSMLKDAWFAAIRDAGLDVALWPDVPDHAAIELFIGWRPPEGIFAKLTNLKAVQVMGAGVDSVIDHPAIPRRLKLLRIADPLMGQRMATWVLWAVINTQRDMDQYWADQRARRWNKLQEKWSNRDNQEVRVGIMGLGVMGRETADALTGLRYTVSAWTRSQRTHPNVRGFHGQEQLQQFVGQCQYLVVLLPLTPDTKGIISAELLSWLPKGATVINAGRGGHMVEADVLAALDSGQLRNLVTDVTSPEPLPESSRLWDHPNVRLTPHVAAFTPVATASAQIVENYRALAAGEPIPEDRVVNRNRGY